MNGGGGEESSKDHFTLRGAGDWEPSTPELASDGERGWTQKMLT